MSDPSIIADKLHKIYKTGKTSIVALQDISFSVGKGELFGIIGPDGAGKTTLFRILTTLMLADRGRAYVEGHDVVREYRSIRRCVGYMPGRFSLYHDLSVKENLAFFASLFNTSPEENYDLVKEIYEQLAPFENRRAGQLSGGMKQKLALCCALIHRPSLLFLDEPTTGVDAVSRKEFWDMLGRLKAQGISMLVSTSYMDEAGCCDRVALIQEGHILKIDTPEGIIKGFSQPLYTVRSGNMFRLLEDIRKNPIVRTCYPFGQYHHVVFTSPGENGETLLQYLLQKGHTDARIEKIRPGIEDRFMELAGSHLS